jgi:hypothetical protein
MTNDCDCAEHLFVCIPIVQLIVNCTHCLSSKYLQEFIKPWFVITENEDGFEMHDRSVGWMRGGKAWRNYRNVRAMFRFVRNGLQFQAFHSLRVRWPICELPLTDDWFQSLMNLLSLDERHHSWQRFCQGHNESSYPYFHRLCDLAVRELSRIVNAQIETSSHILHCHQVQE